MKRLISIAVVLLLAASANAAIQGEGLAILAAEGQVQIGGLGVQEMSNIQMASQGQAQGGLEGIQQEQQTAIVTQAGIQAGACGVLSQGQVAAVKACQGQYIEPICKPAPPCADPAQGEVLTLTLGQGQTRVGGAGTQVLAQGGVVAQGQTQATPTSFQTEGQFAGGAQFAAQSGLGGEQIQLQALTVTAGQGQSI